MYKGACCGSSVGGDGFWEKGQHSYACCNQLASSTRALAAEAGTCWHAALQRCMGHARIKEIKGRYEKG